VILVGEMRDLETIATAVSAAETGHLVMSTLHTTSAPQTIDRVIDVFPPFQQQQIRVQLAGVLQGIISQQLMPTLDGKGRVAALEILLATDGVRNIIREGKTHQLMTVIQTSHKLGMVSMDYSLAQLARSGRISAEEAYTRCQDQEMLKRYMALGNSPF
jgi:twitching motility protein PilT